eukprot:Partr_v1_DN26334_c2_g1_i1_m43308 putative finger protein
MGAFNSISSTSTPPLPPSPPESLVDGQPADAPRESTAPSWSSRHPLRSLFSTLSPSALLAPPSPPSDPSPSCPPLADSSSSSSSPPAVATVSVGQRGVRRSRESMDDDSVDGADSDRGGSGIRSVRQRLDRHHHSHLPASLDDIQRSNSTLAAAAEEYHVEEDEADDDDMDGDLVDASISPSILRQALELVLFNVLQEQMHIREVGIGPDGEGDDSVQVQLFYYIGSFRVEAGVAASDPERAFTPAAANSSNPLADVLLSSRSVTEAPIDREIQREWISANTMRLLVDHSLRTEQPVVADNVVELPVVMLGARDNSIDLDNANNGWIMYVVGGQPTSAALAEVTRRAAQVVAAASVGDGDSQDVIVNNNARVVGSSGRILMVARPADSEPTPTETMILNSIGNRLPNNTRGQPVAADMSSEEEDDHEPPAPLSPETHSLGILLAALLSGLHEQGPAGVGDNSNPLLQNLFSLFDARQDNGEHDTYDLFWRISNLLGYARPRNVSKDLVDEKLTSVSYRQFKMSKPTLKADDCQCPICLAEFDEDEELRVLMCDHVFHRECVDQWLTVHVNNCPLCRNVAVQVPATDAKEE